MSAGTRSGRELHPGERAADHLGERLHGEGLGHPGHAFEQAVAAGEQRDEHPLHHPVLPDDHPFDLEQRPLQQGGVLRGGGHRRRRLGAAPFGVGASGVVGWATGPPQRWSVVAASVRYQDSHARLRAEVGRSRFPPRRPRSAESRDRGCDTDGGPPRVRFTPSPGGSPRGRPALKLLGPAAPRLAGMSDPLPRRRGPGLLGPGLPRRRRLGACAGTIPGCTTPDRRKTWLACAEHRSSARRLPRRPRLPA